MATFFFCPFRYPNRITTLRLLVICDCKLAMSFRIAKQFSAINPYSDYFQHSFCWFLNQIRPGSGKVAREFEYNPILANGFHVFFES